MSNRQIVRVTYFDTILNKWYEDDFDFPATSTREDIALFFTSLWHGRWQFID